MLRRRHPLPSSAQVPPMDDDDLLREILLRLPPQPSSLPRAAAVCKRWRGIVLDDETGLFVRRFRAHHRKNPPLLGFFVSGWENRENRLSFVPTPDPPDHVPAARFPPPPRMGRLLRGCRQGLVLFFDWRGRRAVLWDPLTGHRRRVSFPSPPWYEGGSVMKNQVLDSTAVCAAGDAGHVHGACHLGPFKLVVAGYNHGTNRAFACVYGTESGGEWGDFVSVQAERMAPYKKSVLVGSKLCWLLCGGSILEFDLESQSLVVIEKPTDACFTENCVHVQILRTEDNGVGLAICTELNIQIWERKSDSQAVVKWVLQKSVQLGELITLRPGALDGPTWIRGYDEDTNVIFLSMYTGNFMLQLKSMKFKDISKIYHGGGQYYPYTNFYTGRGIGGADDGADMSNDS